MIHRAPHHPRTLRTGPAGPGTAVVLVVGAALFGAVPPARAQWGDTYDAPRSEEYAAPPRRRARDAYRDDGYGYAARPVPRRYAPPPQEAPRQFYWPWEDRPQQAQPQMPPQTPPSLGRAPRPRPSGDANRDANRASARKRVRPAPEIAQPKAVVPKAAAGTQVAVLGDTLAQFLRKGLDDVFQDNADVAIADRSKGDSGLVRRDVLDWPKAAEEYLKANPRTAYALLMLGVNDRQAIREGDQSFEPLTDKWRELYGARVDALIKVFTDRKVPLVWVGLPPVRGEDLSKDFSAINDLVRERMQRAGQAFVDIWPGFVDDRDRYAAIGPDVDGQEARLRTADGIHFTAAGARKVAHFADIELKRLMGTNPAAPVEAPAVATLPGTAPGTSSATSPGTSPAEGAALDDTAAIDRKITAMLPSLPEPPGIPSLPVRPVAGPVVPLGRVELSPGGALTAGRPREGDAALERSLQRGVAPLPQPGRADDFRWPPG